MIRPRLIGSAAAGIVVASLTLFGCGAAPTTTEQATEQVQADQAVEAPSLDAITDSYLSTYYVGKTDKNKTVMYAKNPESGTSCIAVVDGAACATCIGPETSEQGSVSVTDEGGAGSASFTLSGIDEEGSLVIESADAGAATLKRATADEFQAALNAAYGVTETDK